MRSSIQADSFFWRRAAKRAPMTAAELEAHPEFPHVTWDLKPTKKGRIPVAAKRGGPLNISYEVHGHGSRRIVVCLLYCCASFPSVEFGPAWSINITCLASLASCLIRAATAWMVPALRML
jgi:hypothetical protein